MLEKINRFSSMDPLLYIQTMQKTLQRKMVMLQTLKQKADIWMSKLQEERETNMGDEQLLQGLAMQDMGGKLF